MVTAISIYDLVKNFITAVQPMGVILDENTITAQCLEAVKFYLGYGDLSNYDRERDELTKETLLTKSEVAVINPLFKLYVERENALILESSRSLGVESYGRSVSEISNEIQQKEQEIQNLAFSSDIFTI